MRDDKDLLIGPAFDRAARAWAAYLARTPTYEEWNERLDRLGDEIRAAGRERRP